MTIKNVNLTKQIVLYLLSKPFVEDDFPMWVEEE